MEKTLIIIKPDAIKRWLIWEVICRLEKKWLKMVWNKMRILDKAILEVHYAHLTDKPFFADIVQFMTSTPVILQVWEWKEAADVVRLMMWVTNSRQAQPGTIRWEFSMSKSCNIIHGSENVEIAQAEIERFFQKEEIYSYELKDFDYIYSGDEIGE